MISIPHRFNILFLSALCLFGAAWGAVHAEEQYGKAADNRIFAQTLVNQIKAENADVLWAGVHAAAPGLHTFSIIASTLDLIGKRSDDNDVDVALEGRSHLTPNAKLGKIGIMMPLKDAGGRLIGSLGMAFKYRDEDDQAALFSRATMIRDHAAKKLADHGQLFKPIT